jgi:hypothetical protein
MQLDSLPRRHLHISHFPTIHYLSDIVVPRLGTSLGTHPHRPWDLISATGDTTAWPEGRKERPGGKKRTNSAGRGTAKLKSGWKLVQAVRADGVMSR